MAEHPMDIEQFRADGLLQEANRHFFHPLGLALTATRMDARMAGVRIVLGDDGVKALEWVIDRAVEAGATTEDYVENLRKAIKFGERVEAGDVWLTGVMESDDPEGYIFGEDPRISDSDGIVLASTDERKRKREEVDARWVRYEAVRTERLGFMVQEL